MKFHLIAIILLFISCQQVSSDWIDRTKHAGVYDMASSELFEICCTEENPENIENTIGNLEQAKVYYIKIFKGNLNLAVFFGDNSNWDKYAFLSHSGVPQTYYKGVMALVLGNFEMAMQVEQGLKDIE